jgi:hypothetical protein
MERLLQKCCLKVLVWQVVSSSCGVEASCYASLNCESKRLHVLALLPSCPASTFFFLFSKYMEGLDLQAHVSANRNEQPAASKQQQSYLA